MKCIYCNSENELTISDIITYSITGKKLVINFVYKNHNTFTNDRYENEFANRLNGFRNRIGLKTRNGNQIKYKSDITVGNVKIEGVTLSDTKALFGNHLNTGSVNGNKTGLPPAAGGIECLTMHYFFKQPLSCGCLFLLIYSCYP